MKHTQKVIPKEPWPKEKTQEAIEKVKLDIAAFNNQIIHIDGQIKELQRIRVVARNRISRKWKYLRQLEEQLNETK